MEAMFSQALICCPLPSPRVFSSGALQGPGHIYSRHHLSLSLVHSLFSVSNFSGLPMPPSLHLSLIFGLPVPVSESVSPISRSPCLYLWGLMELIVVANLRREAGGLLKFLSMVNAPRGTRAPVDSGGRPPPFPGLPRASRAFRTEVGAKGAAPGRRLLQFGGRAVHGPRRIPLLP